MDPVKKAIWFIESHLAGDITLGEVAKVSGVSSYQITRMFSVVTGYSAMRYVRSRRLTEAARALAQGTPNILAVALEARYGSHEAFTRAFRDQFGVTPEMLRAQRDLANVPLVEPRSMDGKTVVELEPPRFETSRSLLVAGFRARFARGDRLGIPRLWQRFLPHLGKIPGQAARFGYGVFRNRYDVEGTDYISGVEVFDVSRLPSAFSHLRIPEQRYAVFFYRDHVSTIPSAWHSIWNHWLPESGHEAAAGPYFERYDERLDTRWGTGGLELWLPIRS